MDNYNKDMKAEILRVIGEKYSFFEEEKEVQVPLALQF